jgi:hypothetical protein
MSMSKTFANLNGKKVIKRVTGIHTVETIDQFLAEIKASIEARPDIVEKLAAEGLSASDIKDEGNKFTLSQFFWMKPKLKAVEVGVLHVRSKDYYFVPDSDQTAKVHGDKKGATWSVTLDKFEKPINPLHNRNSNGLISFELAK